ncbi:MAG: uridine kinase [Bacteroidetes bacterium]|jgi:uridine kinase|nr:uridine kinase [Bacteroidota bacterium]MDA0972583.1 uridine kinase [Bacteroidota bacterium]
MKPCFVIGIAGGSGSGKTSLIQRVHEDIGEDCVTMLSQDDYYHPIHLQHKDHNGEVNFDLPTAIDQDGLIRDVKNLLNGEPITVSRYLFNNAKGHPEDVQLDPRPILLVEGLFIFHYPELYSLMDLKVFIDAHPEYRLKRRILRDGKERGYPESVVRYQWENHVEPAFKDFLLPYQSHCDILIKNDIEMEEGYQDLIHALHRTLEHLHSKI